MMINKTNANYLHEQEQICNISQNFYTNDSMEKGSNSFVIVLIYGFKEIYMQINLTILCEYG